MIFFFPGQILPDDLRHEVGRVGGLLERYGIDAIANVALHVEMIADAEFATFSLRDSGTRTTVLHVPNMCAAELFDDPHDPLEDVMLLMEKGAPLTLRSSKAYRSAVMQGVVGPLRRSPQHSDALGMGGAQKQLGRIDYDLIADLFGGVWRLTQNEVAKIFGLEELKTTGRKRENLAIQPYQVKLARAAFALHDELRALGIDDYGSWFRTPWPQHSPIRSMTPAEALFRGGHSAFVAITAFLQFELANAVNV